MAPNTATLADQTGEPRRVLAADYSTKRLGIVSAQGKLEWEYPIQDIHEAWVLPNGNVLFQTSWTDVVEVSPTKKIVWKYDAARQNGNEGKRVEVHAFQRLADGVTMIAESGPARIIEVDRDGKLLREIKLQVEKPDAHRDTRLARKLVNGRYLVCHEGDATVREYDSDGAVVWSHNVKSAVYSAERLKNGNTLIGTGNGNRVVEVDRDGREVWSVEKNDLAGITLSWITMVERRPNGNTLIVNCHGGKNQPQILEVTPQKKVVWTFSDFDHFGNSLPVARVLDER
jgi:outer membrane protein assembly factor BamB